MFKYFNKKLSIKLSEKFIKLSEGYFNLCTICNDELLKPDLFQKATECLDAAVNCLKE